MATVEEIELARAERRAALEEQRLAQHALDLEALNNLEIEHGESSLVRVKPKRFIPGQPTFVVLRLANPVEFKRYSDMVNGRGGAAGDTMAAAVALCDVCLLYPSKDVFRGICQRVATMPIDCAVATLKAGEGVAIEEGKG